MVDQQKCLPQKYIKEQQCQRLCRRRMQNQTNGLNHAPSRFHLLETLLCFCCCRCFGHKENFRFFFLYINIYRKCLCSLLSVPLRSVKWTIRFVDRRSHRHTTFTVTVHLTCLRLILLIVSCFWDGDLWFHLLLNLPASLRWWFWWNNPQQTQKESPYESVLFIKETQVCICTENFLRKNIVYVCGDVMCTLSDRWSLWIININNMA